MNAKKKKFVVIMAVILAALMVGSMATMAISLIISSLSQHEDDHDDHEGHDHAYAPYENTIVLDAENDALMDIYDIGDAV